MKTDFMSLSKFRKNMFQIIEKINKENGQYNVMLNKNGNPTVVVMSWSEFERMVEARKNISDALTFWG